MTSEGLTVRQSLVLAMLATKGANLTYRLKPDLMSVRQTYTILRQLEARGLVHRPKWNLMWEPLPGGALEAPRQTAGQSNGLTPNLPPKGTPND